MAKRASYSIAEEKFDLGMNSIKWLRISLK